MQRVPVAGLLKLVPLEACGGEVLDGNRSGSPVGGGHGKQFRGGAVGVRSGGGRLAAAADAHGGGGEREASRRVAVGELRGIGGDQVGRVGAAGRVTALHLYFDDPVGPGRYGQRRGGLRYWGAFLAAGGKEGKDH